MGFWCHIGNTPATFFCCPSNRKVPNLCHLPPNSGFGSDKINRYWYDWRSGFCREMVYSGFGGNENNFVVRDKCEKRCAGTPKPSTPLSPERKSSGDIKVDKGLLPDEILSITKSPKVVAPPSIPLSTTVRPRATTLTFRKHPSTPTPPPPSTSTNSKSPFLTLNEKAVNPCNFPPDKGEKLSPTDSPIFRWYFDRVAEKCVQFYFLGSKGNSNNFEHEDSCLETCGGGPNEITSCKFQMEPGFGDYLIARYYFNEKSKSCRKFTYKGYGGNYNRFTSRSTCEKSIETL
uniref:BPTI/Kunitz inhibitor domain-containing protein n=1 Tax=Panagrolaimus superbus TaxID=310955 RepID=A0A914YRF6_9BILA